MECFRLLALQPFALLHSSDCSRYLRTVLFSLAIAPTLLGRVLVNQRPSGARGRLRWSDSPEGSRQPVLSPPRARRAHLGVASLGSNCVEVPPSWSPFPFHGCQRMQVRLSFDEAFVRVSSFREVSSCSVDRLRSSRCFLRADVLSNTVSEFASFFFGPFLRLSRCTLGTVIRGA